VVARLPSTVAILGAGTMGAGMAAVFAAHGSQVRLAARRPETLAQAGLRIERIAGQAAARVTTTTDVGEATAGADLIVETISEELEAKRTLLVAAERSAPEAILTSNTSSLSLQAIAEPLERPERFAGLHWLNPPELVELVEVVGAGRTDPAILTALASWMDALGKAPVVLPRQLPGFVANRLQYALLREAFALVEQGVCTYEDVDRALTRGLGARWAAIGPFETMDLGGLDVFATVAENLLPELSNGAEPPAFLGEAVAAGALGVKSGRGLRGNYTPEAIETIAARRERVLRAVARARDDEEAR
jgi:3-hydroxybutyryl-CoA dehydrogenase